MAILLLLLRDTLAVAPGDEYDGCEVPDYPVNIKVLMDSWTFLARNDANTTAVWTTGTYRAVSNTYTVNTRIFSNCDSVVFYWWSM